MKSVLAIMVLFLGIASGVAAQSQGIPPPQRTQPVATNLNAVLAQIQQALQATNTDIGRLHIDRWKTDNDQKQQLRQAADSLQRSITNAMPALISDVRANSGNVSTTFKLYHNLNVLYEILIYVADRSPQAARKAKQKKDFRSFSAAYACATLSPWFRELVTPKRSLSRWSNCCGPWGYHSFGGKC